MSKPLYSGQFSVDTSLQGTLLQKKFSSKTYLADSAKIVVVKIIFHVLFLALETRKKKKYNKIPTISINSFPSEVW